MANENQSSHSKDNRRYERYRAMIKNKLDEKSPIEIKVQDVPAQLLDFSVGGFYVRMKKMFSLGETVNLSVDLDGKGRISLLGTVVRANPEPDNDSWGIAIDLSQFYGMKITRKI